METTYGKSQNEISAGLFKEIQEKLGICAAQNKGGRNQTGQGILDSVGYVNALKFYVSIMKTLWIILIQGYDQFAFFKDHWSLMSQINWKGDILETDGLALKLS